MTARTDAWVSFEYHEAGGLLDDDGISLRAMVKTAFKAGWEAAGGDQRLEVIGKLDDMVTKCCGDKAGKVVCESYGCGTMQNLIRGLGSEPENGPEEALMPDGSAAPPEKLNALDEEDQGAFFTDGS